jgi:hypothetical protein
VRATDSYRLTYAVGMSGLGCRVRVRVESVVISELGT